MTDRLARFDANTTTDDVLAGLDLSGRTALVTGGTSGLGRETARALAAKGAHVILTARTAEKGARVAAEVAEETGGSVEAEVLELGSLASVRALAGRLNARDGALDMLILNAGVMACPHMTTEDGFELQFGTNHLGHFLLTGLIAGKVADGGRIVAVSSAAHRMSPVVFDDIQFEQRDYDRWGSYGQSKTANVLFAVELNKRLAHRGIEAFSLHPGVIVTELARHMSDEDRAMFQKGFDTGTIPLKTTPQGAATQVLAATAPELAGKGGAYLADCAICPIGTTPTRDVVQPYALDPEAAARLWQISEQMVGETFSF